MKPAQAADLDKMSPYSFSAKNEIGIIGITVEDWNVPMVS